MNRLRPSSGNHYQMTVLGLIGMTKAEFEASHVIEPNRFRGLYSAAELAGEMEKARTFYEQLIVLGATADGERPELAMAQEFLASKWRDPLLSLLEGSHCFC